MARAVNVDQFTYIIKNILNDVRVHMNAGMPKAVQASVRKGRRETVANISTSGIKSHTGKYASGWATRTKRDSSEKTTGVVYNKVVPGLPHLLEKGHAKVGGGRVAGHEHIAPAAETAFEDFEERIKRLVDTL